MVAGTIVEVVEDRAHVRHDADIARPVEMIAAVWAMTTTNFDDGRATMTKTIVTSSECGPETTITMALRAENVHARVSALERAKGRAMIEVATDENHEMIGDVTTETIEDVMTETIEDVMTGKCDRQLVLYTVRNRLFSLV